MPDARHESFNCRNSDATRRVIGLAESQGGVITWAQLESCGLNRAAISRWSQAGRLLKVHPAVYAVGHRLLSVEGRLRAALLWAGNEGGLAHQTAAYWWQINDALPRVIHIAVPTRRNSSADVTFHRSRNLALVTHRGLPLTSVSQTLMDVSERSTVSQLRQMLAEADYRKLLDIEEMTHLLRQGRRGAVKLGEALERHQPLLAMTRRELEKRFLALLERSGLPMPEINARVGRIRVDALWRAQKVAVELDGGDGHGSPGQLERDHRRDLHLRARGFVVLRYTWRQVVEEPDAVLADLARAIAAARAA